MKKNYTHISLILDRSGSMEPIKQDTIGGFNEFLQKQKEEKGECTFSMIQFDNEYNVVYSFVPIKEVSELDEKTFIPRASTALHDAIGRTIASTGEELSKINESQRPERVLLVILTDGYENASQEYSSQQIIDLIKTQTEKYNWQFIYLGAGQDAIAIAGELGIKAGNAMSFVSNSRGVDASYMSMSKTMSNYRNMSSKQYLSKDNNAFDQEDRDNQKESM